MTHFRLTPDVKSDLIEIRRFTIKQWDVAQSQKYLSALRQTIRLLAETPTLGRSRPDLGTDVLGFPQASHVIYYVLHEQQLVVFGVLHKLMVPLDHLSGREVI
ncbi:MAG: type II toxin-antitoxin system RelE/ParE family toxin [Gammaproteobacteria bacterium]|nr:type II toxin-antitoxin system RelE/ParE family toxin [Gammaproteobacteria bacterium]MCF6361893.1 type II toxin-antitoxin system RelE/ParE family toxin [Gammaproteobacteria bacterium]